MTHSIGIIGGGAAGMMAAISAIEHNPEVRVTLFDKNPGLGAKVIISGGGRCNVTTGYHDIEYVLNHYPRGKRFLKNAIYAFPPSEAYDWFESRGVPLKMEKDMRVFPISDDGTHVVRVFERCFNQNSVALKCKTHIQKAAFANNKFILSDSEGSSYEFDRLIITTGGQAYRHTGSTGDGYAFAETFGHSLTELGPSLNSFVVKESFGKELAGVSHQEVSMKTILKSGEKVSYSGPFVWTHSGISGPVVFAMSSHMAFEPCTDENPNTLYVDFCPTHSQPELEEYCFSFITQNQKLPIYRMMQEFVPKSVVHKLFAHMEIDSEKPCNETKHAHVRKIAERFKQYPLTIVGRGKGTEFVTAGGVKTSEVFPKTMESRIQPGLYFAGEILDVDGFTGGFNLQASWATGRLAGINASHV